MSRHESRLVKFYGIIVIRTLKKSGGSGLTVQRGLSGIGATGGGAEENRMKRSLKCRCGQRICQRDVMRQGYYVRQFGPSYVYIRYRCARCKRLGEHFIRQEDWEENALCVEAGEVSDTERSRFARMGSITLDEINSFQKRLEGIEIIPDPLKDD